MKYIFGHKRLFLFPFIFLKIENFESNAIENETISSIGSSSESFQNCKATSVSFMNIPTPSAKSSAAQTAYR